MSTALERRMAANLGKLYAIRFLFWMHFFASVLIPFYRDWGGISYQQVFVLNAWFMLWSFVLEVPTGTIADFFGRKVSLAAGALTAALASLIYASVPNLSVFLVAEILFAIAFTLMSGADEALAWDSLKAISAESRAKQVLARMESFKLIGLVSAALAGSLIAREYGLRAPMRVQVAPFLVCALVAASLHEPAVGARERDPSGSYLSLLRGGFRYFRSHPSLRALTLDMVGVGGLTWMIIWLYQPTLERAGIGLGWFGATHAAMCLTQVAVLSRLLRLEAWCGSQRGYLRASAVIPGLGFCLLATQPGSWLTVPLVLTIAGFGLTRVAVFSSYINGHIPSEQRATVLSVISMARTLATAAMNLAVGTLADYSLPVTLAAVGTGILVVAVIVAVDEDHLAGQGPRQF